MKFKQLLFLIFPLIFFGCQLNVDRTALSTDPVLAYAEEEVSIAQTEDHKTFEIPFDPATEALAAGLMFGTTHYERVVIRVDVENSTASLEYVEEAPDWETNEATLDTLFRQAWRDVLAVSDFLVSQNANGNLTYAVGSFGFTTNFGENEIKNAIRRTNTWINENYPGFNLPPSHMWVDLLSGQQEAYYEHTAFTDRDPNALSIGMGGGSIQIGCSDFNSCFALPHGYKSSEVPSEQDVRRTVSNNMTKQSKATDYAYFSGGAAIHAIQLAGKKIQNNEPYSIRIIEDAIDILSTDATYRAITTTNEVRPKKRESMRASLIACHQAMLEAGVEDVYLAKKEHTWLAPYAGNIVKKKLGRKI